jgi:hypothetical protein
MESELQITDPNRIAILQQRRLVKPFAIQIGAVATAHVLKQVAPVAKENLSVLPGDRTGVEHDIAVGMPAKHHFPILQADLLASLLLWTSHQRDVRHRYLTCRSAFCPCNCSLESNPLPEGDCLHASW